MRGYRQSCRYCYEEHSDWWMMDQRDYNLVDGRPTIILCGRCEHTQAQAHETSRHRFQSVTEIMRAEAFASLKSSGVTSGQVTIVPCQSEAAFVRAVELLRREASRLN
jgi:hypothetical protein